MDNNENRMLTDEELDKIFGGYDYSLDLENKTVTVTLEEDEDPVETLKKLPELLPIPLSRADMETLNKTAMDMQQTGLRNCRATFSISFFGIRITGIEAY